MISGNQSNPYRPPFFVDHTVTTRGVHLRSILATFGVCLYPLGLALCEISNLKHFPPEPIHFAFASLGFAGLSILAGRFIWLGMCLFCLYAFLAISFGWALMTGWQSPLGWDMVAGMLQTAGVAVYGYACVAFLGCRHSPRAGESTLPKAIK